MNAKAIQAPLKDRMIVYVGVAIVLMFSWLYILGMGWHMNTLPFTDNTTMSMDMPEESMSMKDNDMDMNKQEMKDMNQESNMITRVITWMPPMGNMWALTDFFLLFMMWAVMMIAMMTPSILPMLMLYTTLNARKKVQGQESASTMILLVAIYQAGCYLVCLLLFLSTFYTQTDF